VTYLTVIVYDTTSAEAGVIRGLLNDAALTGDDTAPDGEVVVLGRAYTANHALLSAGDAADQLEADAPGSTWQVWSDPEADELGELIRYTPLRGRFDAACDADGDPCLSGKELDMLVAEAAGGDPARAAAMIGRPWAEQFTALAAREGEVVVPVEVGEEPPPVDGPARDALAVALHRSLCGGDHGFVACADHGAPDAGAAADAVIAAGWRPWGDHPEP
jgi:hypothetical protein